MDQLNNPTDLIIDDVTDSIIIADRWNKRIIQCFTEKQGIFRYVSWLSEKQKVLVEDIDCCSLFMDKDRYLYVSNGKKM